MGDSMNATRKAGARVGAKLGAAGALLLFALLASSLSAQVQQFPTTSLPAGWSMSPGNVSALWAVDANPTVTPYQPTTITPYRSAPYSLNYNNGSNCYNGVQNSGGVMSEIYDVTYASNPKLEFWHMIHHYYTYYCQYYGWNYYHAKTIRIWDVSRTTMHYSQEFCCTNYLCNWVKSTVNLQKQWGQIRVEFHFGNTYWYSTNDQYSAGWFIDDVEITGLTPPSLTISNGMDLGNTVVNQPYNLQFNAVYGTAPYTAWAVVSGALPPGLTLNPTSGALSGTPTNSGKYGFGVRVTDSAAATETKVFKMVVARPAGYTPPGAQNIPFEDDFFIDRGWMFATNTGALTATSAGGWERGYATPSVKVDTQEFGDPATDHSPTADNFIMGVNIGGTWNAVPGVVMNSWYYAVSPPINVGGFQLLEWNFWRWVNGYYYYVPAWAEYQHPTTGAWVKIWETTYSDQYNSSWVEQKHDINFGSVPAPGATTRLRFSWRFTYNQPTYYSGGFNVDDVRVLEKPQPGVLVANQFEVFSTQYVGSSPKVYVGNTYPVILRVNNSSPYPIHVNSLNYLFHLSQVPQPVGHLDIPNPPTTANPWVVPANAVNHFISNQATPNIQFVCTGLASYGNGTSVVFHMELFGKEQGPGAPNVRATLTNTQTDPCGDEVISVFTTPSLAITDPVQLPDANINQAYSYIFTAQFGTPPYVNWGAQNLPSWLNFDAPNKRIYGTPTPADVPAPPQTFNFTISVEDSATPAATANKQFALTVKNGGAQPLQIVTSSQMPNATEQSPYAAVTFNAAGGTPNYTWAMVGGSLPGGVTFAPASATLSGNPNPGTSGSYSFNIRVTDSVAAQVTRTFYINVLPANLQVAITTPSTPGATGAPPAGLETAPYNGGNVFIFDADGGFVGTAPNEYQWTVTSGSIPTGLTLNPETGRLSGVPTAAGVYTFVLRASDGAFPPSEGSAQYSITIDALVPQPLQIMTPSALAQGAEANPYSVAMEAQFGVTPYSWGLKTGSSLPLGLGISSQTGAIAGVIQTGQAASPSQVFTFTVEVTDSSSTPQVAEKTFTLEIVAFVVGPMSITTPNDLPQGGVQNPYSVTLKATGGNPVDPQNPYQWTIAAGSTIPSGLFMNVNGRLDGIPGTNTAGNHSFTIEVSDGSGTFATKTFNLQINGYPVSGGGAGTVEVGKRRTETVPFWESCSIGAGAGAMPLAPLLAMFGVALLRRRRKQ